MTSIKRRLDKLEGRHGMTEGPLYLLLLMHAGQEVGPEEEAYIEDRVRSGLLPKSGFASIDLTRRIKGESAET